MMAHEHDDTQVEQQPPVQEYVDQHGQSAPSRQNISIQEPSHQQLEAAILDPQMLVLAQMAAAHAASTGRDLTAEELLALSQQQTQNQEQFHLHHHQQPQYPQDQHQQIAAPFPHLEHLLPGGLTPEQTLAYQQFQAMQGISSVVPEAPRAPAKRRKPIKWELWEEKNLIEGVRRYGRGNWAQIRATFEFNPCRTNVDLHDKWRVLTGERKRSRQAQKQANSMSNGGPIATLAQQDPNQLTGNAGVALPAGGVEMEIPQGDGTSSQKVQLIPVDGSGGLYTLAPSNWTFDGQELHFTPEMLGLVQQHNPEITEEMLANLQQQALNFDDHQQYQMLMQNAQQLPNIPAAEIPFDTETASQPVLQEPVAATEPSEEPISKRPKYERGAAKTASEDEAAQELLKLSSPSAGATRRKSKK